MKKIWIVLVIVLALVALWSVVIYNGFANTEEDLEQAYARVDSLYTQQRKLISGLLEIAENAPALTEGEKYKGIAQELAETEERTAIECAEYNEAVRSYNESLRRFPNNMFARMFGFRESGYYE